MTSSCSHCGYPSRTLRGHSTPTITWEKIAGDAWGGSLLRCPTCQQLWFLIPYEPFAAYAHFVPFPFDEDLYRQHNDPPKGYKYKRIAWWHMGRIFELFDAATPQMQNQYLSEGVTDGCVYRLKAGLTPEFLLFGEHNLSFDEVTR